MLSNFKENQNFFLELLRKTEREDVFTFKKADKGIATTTKRKQQTNIPYIHKYKKSQHTSKSYPIKHKNNYSAWESVIYPKDTGWFIIVKIRNLIHQQNDGQKKKKKPHMIISTDNREVLDEMWHPI